MADFIDIVESSRWLIDRALSSSNNDDFVNLGTKSIEDPAAAAAVSNDNILTALVSDGSSYTTSTSPFLSKSAEVELYLLATNFLLYVAMVIITTIVAKVYFPDSLKRGTIPNIRRRYSYRRKTEHDEEDEQRSYVNDEEDELEALYSDDDDDDENDSRNRTLSGDYEEEDALFSDMSHSRKRPPRNPSHGVRPGPDESRAGHQTTFALQPHAQSDICDVGSAARTHADPSLSPAHG